MKKYCNSNLIDVIKKREIQIVLRSLSVNKKSKFDKIEHEQVVFRSQKLSMVSTVCFNTLPNHKINSTSIKKNEQYWKTGML